MRFAAKWLVVVNKRKDIIGPLEGCYEKNSARLRG